MIRDALLRRLPRLTPRNAPDAIVKRIDRQLLTALASMNAEQERREMLEFTDMTGIGFGR